MTGVDVGVIPEETKREIAELKAKVVEQATTIRALTQRIHKLVSRRETKQATTAERALAVKENDAKSAEFRGTKNKVVAIISKEGGC